MHLVGFITKKFVTMHGHMNVKKMFIRRCQICNMFRHIKVPQSGGTLGWHHKTLKMVRCIISEYSHNRTLAHAQTELKHINTQNTNFKTLEKVLHRAPHRLRVNVLQSSLNVRKSLEAQIWAESRCCPKCALCAQYKPTPCWRQLDVPKHVGYLLTSDENIYWM